MIMNWIGRKKRKKLKLSNNHLNKLKLKKIKWKNKMNGLNFAKLKNTLKIKAQFFNRQILQVYIYIFNYFLNLFIFSEN